jgi:hypothetical protein
MTNDTVFTLDPVVRRIVDLRGQRVMLGSDLAILYGVEYRALIQAVKRNIDRFPDDFMFQLSAEEWGILKSQNVISSLRSQNGASKRSWGGSRFAPYAFTEHGALMLSSVLRSPRAVEISLLIIRAFVWLRQTVPAYQELAAKLMELENAVVRHDNDTSMILEALRQFIIPPDKEKRRTGF